MRSLGLVLMFAVALSVRFAFLCDDAFISMRYARNLARGVGLRYNPGDHVPVEGFSNLLWVLYGALFEGVLLDPTFWLPLTSGGVGLLGVAAVYGWGRMHLGLSEPMALLAAAIVGWSPAWAVWSTGGLATVPFAVAVLWMFERAVLSDRSTVVQLVGVGLVVMLTRIEGGVWVAAILGFGAFVQQDRRVHLARAAGALGVALLLYTAWRGWHFSTVWPHTASVKVGLGPQRLERGLRYVALFGMTFVSPVLVGLLAPVVARSRRDRALVGMIGGTVLFAVFSGGDFLPMGRLLIVGLPFGAWILALALERAVPRVGMLGAVGMGLGLLAVGTLPAGGVSLVPEAVLAQLHMRYTDVAPMSEAARWHRTRENALGFAVRGQAIADYAGPGDSMVAPAVGAVGYYSGLYLYDQHGLVTRDVGLRDVSDVRDLRSPGHDKYVPASWFAPREPTLLHTKVVHGKRSGRRMRDWIDRWDIPVALQAEYAPRFHEIAVPGRSERHFLLLIQRVEPHEDAAELWRNFFERTRSATSDL